MTVASAAAPDLWSAELLPLRAALRPPGQLGEALRAAQDAHRAVQALRRVLVEREDLDPEAEQRLASLVRDRDERHRVVGARLVALLDGLGAPDKIVEADAAAPPPEPNPNKVVCEAPEPDSEAEVAVDDGLIDEITEEFNLVGIHGQPPPLPAPESPPASPLDLSQLDQHFRTGPRQAAPSPLPSVCWPDAELSALGPPARIRSAADYAGERQRLAAVVQGRQAWARLDRGGHLELARLILARLRHLQDEASGLAPSEPLKALFGALGAHVRDQGLGRFEALDRSARPAAGTWLAEAQAAWKTLCPPEARAPAPLKATLKAALKARLAVEEAEEARQDSALSVVPAELLARTRGKRAIIIGGDKRSGAQARIQAGLELASLDWETGLGVRRAAHTAERCANGRFDLVIFLKRFLSHKLTDQVLPSCSGAEIVWIDQGYGLSAVVRTMMGGAARAR